MGHLSKLRLSCLFLSITPSLLFAEQYICSSQSAEDGFVDTGYHYLNTKFCQPAVWFDSFFMDEQSREYGHAGSMLRWYNDFSMVEKRGFVYKSGLTVRLYLPNFTRKLKLVFESEEEDQRIGMLSKESEQTQSTFGLRYDLYSKGRSSFNLKATLRPGIEARYRYTYPFSEKTIGRFTQKLYQRKNVTGEITYLDIDYSINPIFLFRWANFLKFETDLHGFETGSGFTLYQFISPTQAISYQTSITGRNNPYHYINNSNISVTYRHNILRKWFFYEIIPEINWNKEADTLREQELMITLRLEVLFKNI
ncbi:hypothetical protein [Psychromonas sp.]|uniref:hypothetical protein n=1 Tax=Psychromonas sp. TaxID=1884585 RepID=UPI0039E3FCD7